jgi:ectoine hydroxylase-related dioxygenase (phytanoyl-CoA dioxygenase family)
MDKQYGITNQAQSGSLLDLQLEEFRHLGYTLIEDVLTESELTELREELHRVYDLQEAVMTKEGIQSINEEYMARALLAYSEPYLSLAINKKMLPFVEHLLGQYYVLHLQNGIINMPNEAHHQSSWHRDIPYQNWVSSEPLACNVFYCLDTFNAETGATLLLPYSHKIPFMPSAQYVNKHAIQINAKPGSAILFDSMVFHKAGYNSSTIIRRGINNIYTKGFIRQQIDLPSVLKGKYAENPFLNMLLGYDAQSSPSVDDFRNRRLTKMTRK